MKTKIELIAEILSHEPYKDREALERLSEEHLEIIIEGYWAPFTLIEGQKDIE